MSDAISTFIDGGMHMGRMISGSKSGYVQRNPNNLVVFNANLCTKEQGKIWYGDLDITKDEKALSVLAGLLGETVYVLREMDARFDNESSPKFDRAVAVFHTDGKVEIT